MKKRVEELVVIVENEEGATTLADVAEQRVIDTLRAMGRDTLTLDWSAHMHII